ncbi:MAG: MFS transporter [Spirochaetes bacterium]|nr:MFS transporter [Spirochaetota bacterium]MBN2769557.1 MFS transporter [Spirochaetota bacterium]
MKKRDMLLILAAYILQIYMGITIAIRGFLLPEINNDFSINYQSSGLMFLVPLIPALIGSFFGGYLYKIMRRKIILLSGTLLLTLLQAALAYSPNYLFFLAINSLLGFATLIVILGVNIGVSAFFQAHAYRYRESSIHLLHFFFGAGAIIALAFAKTILDFSGSWRYVYLSFSSVSLLTFIILIIATFPDSEHKNSQKPKEHKFRLPVITSKVMLFFAMAAIGYVGIEFTIINWAPTFMEDFLGRSKDHISKVMIAFFILFTAGRLVSALISHRIKQEHLFALLSGITLLIVVPAFILPVQIYGCYVFIPLSGLTISGLFPIIQNGIIKRFNSEIDLATGSLYASSNIGSAFMPFFAGAISHQFGLSRGLYLLPFLTLLMILSYLLAGRAACTPD